MLVFLKDADAEYQRKRRQWLEGVLAQKKMKIKKFKTGCRVQLQGFKKNDMLIGLNGLTAIIVGARKVKDNAIMWPVKLLNESVAEVFVKPMNMKKL